MKYFELSSYILLITFQSSYVHAQLQEPPGTKRVDEVEDEIGYIQSLVLKTPSIVSVESSFQRIEIYESDHYGKVFILDDCLQLTEKDASHYNEMLAHVPIMEYVGMNMDMTDEKSSFQVAAELKVLVLGGGDGYVISELLKYPFIEKIDHVEIDEVVTNVSKQHFPWTTNIWNGDAVNLIIDDGAEYVEKQAMQGTTYNIIIQDASDPFYMKPDGTMEILPSHVLYTESHFKNMYKLLEPEKGVLLFQAETYNIPSNLEGIRKWRKILSEVGFSSIRYGSISIGSYPTGQIGFFAAHARETTVEMVCNGKDVVCGGEFYTNGTMDLTDFMDWTKIWSIYSRMLGNTHYYHPRIHRR